MIEWSRQRPRQPGGQFGCEQRQPCVMPALGEAHDEHGLTGLEQPARAPDRGDPAPTDRARASVGSGHGRHFTPRSRRPPSDAVNRQPAAASGLLRRESSSPRLLACMAHHWRMAGMSRITCLVLAFAAAAPAAAQDNAVEVRRRRLRRTRGHRAVGALQRDPGPRLRPQRQRRLPHRRRLLQPRRGAERSGAGGRGRPSGRQRRPPRVSRAIRRCELSPAPGRSGERAAARRGLARLRHAGGPGRRLVSRRRFQLRRRIRLASVAALGRRQRRPRPRRRRRRRVGDRARPAAARLRNAVPARATTATTRSSPPRRPCRRASRSSTSTRRPGPRRKP